MDIHLFTSGKGGAGKTLCALSTTLHYLAQGLKVLAIDLNLQNCDLFRIFENFGFKPVAENYSIIEIQKGRGYVVSTDIASDLHYGLPLGIENFHKEYLGNIFNIDFIHKFKPDKCIIDTGFHPANLLISKGKNWDKNTTKFFSNNTLHLWFIWTLATIRSGDELNKIEILLENLEDHHNWGHFKSSQLIHVINPYALVPGEKNFLWIKLDELSKLSEADVAKAYMPFSFFRDEIKTKLLNLKRFLPIYMVGGEDYISTLVKCIRDSRKGKRPHNVFPLQHYPDLDGYIDRLSWNPVKDTDSLRKVLNKGYEMISKYLTEY